MKNSMMVIGAVAVVGFVKSRMGGFNKPSPFKDVPKGQYFAISKIAKLTGLSEHKVVQALHSLKTQGKVWENSGLYMFR